MSRSRFAITKAVKNAYVFAWQERRYLVKIAALPLAANIVTALYIHLQHAQASPFEGFLWGLPANVLFAWFMFVEARFLLLNERVDQLPPNPDFLQARQRAMQLCVIIWLLFNMSMTALAAYLEWSSGKVQTSIGLAFLNMFLIGAGGWGLRFSVVHILAAVQHSIRRFLEQVEGVEISFRLLGMGLLCVTPPVLIFLAVLAFFIQGVPTANQIFIIVFLASVLSILLGALLNAAAGFALRELMGPSAVGKGDA